MKLLLATHNPHKRREFERLLRRAGARGWEIEELAAEVVLPPEDGASYAENALGKARAAAASTGHRSIADDSGIAAAALDGAPGIRSARFAGEHASDEQNLAKLLREAPAGSPVEYVCVIAYVEPARSGGMLEQVFEARCAGTLAAEPRGEGGFGYDPAFLARDGPAGLTMAELSAEQKDAISHRGRATRELLGWLELRTG